MYRTVKKTTKNTEYNCIGCEYCKPLDEKKEIWGQFVECTAENSCFMASFNAKDYTCIESKGFSEMNETELFNVKKFAQELREKESYKEYLSKIYSKKKAQQLYNLKYGK